MKQNVTGGSSISWTICKSVVPHSIQITTPAPHRSFFPGQMIFPMPNQRCRSTEGSGCNKEKHFIIIRDSFSVLAALAPVSV